MKKMNKKGFTIVELVIVIAVIAILAAVMIPTFSSVVTNAKNSANLQEAKSAYSVYISDTLLANGTPAPKIYVYVNSTTHVTIDNGNAKVVDAAPTTGYTTMVIGANANNEKTLTIPTP